MFFKAIVRKNRILNSFKRFPYLIVRNECSRKAHKSFVTIKYVKKKNHKKNKITTRKVFKTEIICFISLHLSS